MAVYDTNSSFGQYLDRNPGQVDTWDYVNRYLEDAGLGDLTGWAQNLLVEFGQNLSEEQFNQRIRETQSYKTRFRVNDMLKKEGKAPLPEAEILATEKQYAQISQQLGFPKSFYDSPDDYANLIARGVSPAEYQTRGLAAVTAVRNDPRIAEQLQNFYQAGLTEGDLVAFYLDPDKATSAIELKHAAATVGARASQTGWGQISVNDAERLAGQGVTDAQAREGFGTLAAQQGLLQQNASEGNSISRETAMSAVFDNNADAQATLTRRKSERQSQFSGGGNYSGPNKQGLTGAGTSNI